MNPDTAIDEAVFFGDDEDWAIYGGDDEFGLSLFKRISRGVKKGVRKGLKFTKKVLDNPIVKAGVTGLSLVVPAAAPAVGMALYAGKIAKTANKIVRGTRSRNPRKRAAARRVVRNTRRRAKRGDKSSRRAWAILRRANRAGGRLRPRGRLRVTRRRSTMRRRPVSRRRVIRRPSRVKRRRSSLARPRYHVYSGGRFQRVS